MAVSERAAGIVRVVIHVALGLLFVHSGAAAWLWQRVERDVAWRTGPTAVGTLLFFAICWEGWAMVTLGVRAACHPEVLRRIWRRTAHNADPSEYLRMTNVTAHAGRAIVASCILVATQVLIPSMWLPVALAILFLASLLNAYLLREPLHRAITSWAWSGAGVALATLLVHPWFVGQPLFVVRLAIVMTVWDWAGERIGVTPRVLRFVPSLYSGSSG